MSDSLRLPFAFCLALVALAAAMLALAWWDWTYPGLIGAWWQGEHIYPFFWRQLQWALALSGGVCLGLWGLDSYLAAKHSGDASPWTRAALPFALSTLALLVFARYRFHPLGVQPGSVVWTYGLVIVTAGVLAFPMSRLARLCGTRLNRRRGLIAVCLLVLLYAGVYGALTVARHISFRSHALDMGTMDQAAWNTSQGRILERTPLYRAPAEGSRYENRLLDAKLELIFIPLSTLYWLWSDPRTLLVVQTIFLAAGAVPLYGLAVDRLPHQEKGRGAALPALLLAAAYLLYLPLHYVHMADFHPSALMVPLLIAAWWAMCRAKPRQYYVWLVLAMSCRIDAAFVALALGVVIALWPSVAGGDSGARKQGLYTVALAVGWLAFNFGAVVPLAQRIYGPGAGDLVARRFGALGEGPLAIARTVATRPAFVLAQFADRDKLQVFIDLLAPAGFVPLLGPLALLPALPVLAINLLAESTWQHSVHAHYMAPVIPFLWIAAVEGLAWLSTRRGVTRARPLAWTVTLATFTVICALLVSIVLSPFPPGKGFHLANYWQPSTHQEDLRAVVALVPPGATTCAQSDLHPHLAQRRDAALYPYCRLTEEEEAEYVVLDLDAASTKSPLDFHAFYKLIDAWLSREDYGVVAQRGGVLLLRRGASRDNIPEVLAALDTYGRDFYRVQYVHAGLPGGQEAGAGGQEAGAGGQEAGELKANDLYRVPVTLRNVGSQTWHSRGQLPVRLSYRWWTADGALLLVDSMRTDLPHRVEPGNEIKLDAWVRTPSEPGQYILEWDMLREGDAWFGDMGAEMLRQVVTVR